MTQRSIRTIVAVLGLATAVALAPAARADSVAAWGGNAYGESTAPADADFVSVAGGYWHSVALRADGRLAAWGDTLYGQCNVPGGDDFVAVSAGAWHGLALRADGSVAAWGRNTYGQCSVPVLAGVVAVAAGGYHSLALRADGSLAAWGRNDYGQCRVPVGKKYVAIAGGERHSLAIADDGTLVAWGRNDYGQCNLPAGNDYVSVAAGAYHSLALKADGTAVAWGRNDYGQCSVPGGRVFVELAGGERHSLGLTNDGILLAWGRNDSGQCNVPAGNDKTWAGAGWFHSLALYAEPEEPAGHAPVADGQTATTDEDTAAALTLGASDEDGDVLAFWIVTAPLHGTLTGTPPDLVYTPYPDYNGPDAFTFEADDGLLLSNVATVDVVVCAVNDPPVAAAAVNGQASVTVEEADWTGTTVTLDATASHDPDGDALNFAWDTDGDGAAEAFEALAACTYAVGGPYTAQVTVTDPTGASATASVTITVVAGPPANQLGNIETMVLDCVTSGEVAPQIQQSLAGKLSAVDAALAKGGPNATTVAVNNLNALLNQVKAQAGKKIDAEAAAELIARIGALVGSLGD